MNKIYHVYNYLQEDCENQPAGLVKLDNPDTHAFDGYHTHEYNEILVFIKGGGVHNICLKNHPIEDNSLHLLAAKDLHWIQRDMQSKGFVIVYQERFLHKLQSMNPDIDFNKVFGYSRVINLDIIEARNFQLIFQELLNNNNPKVYMLSLIGAFFAKIATLNFEEPVTEKFHSSLIAKVIELIEKQYKKRLTITDYATMLHINIRTLHNHIKKASGMSLHELQQERILNEAKRLLSTSEMNVNEVSLELGFKATAHFTNWFKAKTGCLPSKYKNI